MYELCWNWTKPSSLVKRVPLQLQIKQPCAFFEPNCQSNFVTTASRTDYLTNQNFPLNISGQRGFPGFVIRPWLKIIPITQSGFYGLLASRKFKGARPPKSLVLPSSPIWNRNSYSIPSYLYRTLPKLWSSSFDTTENFEVIPDCTRKISSKAQNIP